MTLWKKILFWTIAVLITLGASVYQRMTGPTHPERLQATIDGRNHTFGLPRSGGETDCEVALRDVPDGTQGTLYWKKFPSDDPFTATPMVLTDGTLSGMLPAQPAAGKLEYYLSIKSSEGDAQTFYADEPLVIRFKGHVPAAVLIPHILLMFGAMLLACYAGITALAGWPVYKKYMAITAWVLLVGGFIFGPLVQHAAFGVYWSGFPVGWDLTDNKTLLAMLGVLAAVLTRRRSWNRGVAIAAVVLLFIVFSIPHSMRGSELDHATGQVETSATH